jgi:hypothetical protein
MCGTNCLAKLAAKRWFCSLCFVIVGSMKETDQFDQIDRRIIRELQRDASLSHAALARR